jgi:energy-coupling factor transporter ATP-binding protein EcfA2
MGEPALVLRARRLRAAPGVVVARDVSLTASRGGVVAVEGQNGSGKTTLLAAAAGLLPAGCASARPGSVGYSPERAGVRAAGHDPAGTRVWALQIRWPGSSLAGQLSRYPAPRRVAIRPVPSLPRRYRM